MYLCNDVKSLVWETLGFSVKVKKKTPQICHVQRTASTWERRTEAERSLSSLRICYCLGKSSWPSYCFIKKSSLCNLWNMETYTCPFSWKFMGERKRISASLFHLYKYYVGRLSSKFMVLECLQREFSIFCFFYTLAYCWHFFVCEQQDDYFMLI